MTSPAQSRAIIAAAERVKTGHAEQEALWRHGFTRRRFLAGAGMVATAGLGSQLVTSRYAFAAPATGNGKTLVYVFLRGGFDGLGTVIPGSDPDYIAARGSMAIPSGSLLNLDRTFGLHPSVAALLPLWTSGQLGIVHAVGATESSRSHFDAQEQVERGVASPGTHTGWLARVLAEMGPGTTFRAVSEGVTVARSLAGAPGAIAMSGIGSLTLLDSQPAMLTALESLFTGLDDPAGAHGLNTLQAMADAIPIQAQFPTPAPGAVYPNDGVGDRMADIARLIKADAGLRVATLDIGGWDMHTNAGAVTGDMANNLAALSQTLSAFATDVGPRISDVTVVTMSEFGRRLARNGSSGTDHGKGGVMFLLGGGVRGGLVHGAWPGLAPAALVQGDLATPNDYRDVLGEVAQRTLGLGSLTSVFPGHTYSPLGVMS